MGSSVLFLISLAVSGYAAFRDIIEAKLPNLAVIAMTILALTHMVLGNGVANTIYGFVFGIVLSIALYILKVWGAGDAKMFAAMSGFVGIFGFFNFLFYTLLSGGVLSLSCMVLYCINNREAHGKKLDLMKNSLYQDIPYGLALFFGFCLQKFF